MFLSLGFLSAVLMLVIGASLAVLLYLGAMSQRAITVTAAKSAAADSVQSATLLCRRYEKDLFLNLDVSSARIQYFLQWKEAYSHLQQAIEQYAALAENDEDRRRAALWRQDSATYHNAMVSIQQGIMAGDITTPKTANTLLTPFKDPIRSLTDSAVAAAAQEQAALQQADRDILSAADRALKGLGGVSLAALLLALIWNRRFSQQLLRPIQQLHEATQRFAQGDLAFRAAVSRRDELGALASSFHRMAEQIQLQQDTEREQRALVQEQNDQLRSLLDLVRDLETPAIPLHDGVLLVPIVGHLDSRRVALLRERVLEAVYDRRADAIVLDLTGLTLIDTQTAQVLQQFVAAVQLLGTRTVITGITPQVAMTVSQLGLSFGVVRIASHVQDGIAAVLGGRSGPQRGAVL
jgi:anti-anti-sigma factor